MNNLKLETFIGRVGRKPDLKYTSKSKAVCSLSVAVKVSDNDPIIWKQVTVWDRQAELCSVQLKKGSEVFVHGRSVTKPYKTESGEEKSYEEVTAKLVGFTNI